MLEQELTRRQFLGGAAVALSASALGLANSECDPAVVHRLKQAGGDEPPRHGVWVWEFSQDGSPDRIAEDLASNGLSVVVKTHDGLDWMSKYDPSPAAIDGPGQVAAIAATFEQRGVPFHAWCVIKGKDPVREAQMAADVLAAGARSLTIDLEGYDDFWIGTDDDALRFGEELRQLSPSERIDLAIDARPWQMLSVPIPQFVQFVDGIRPQLYWDIFDTIDSANAFGYMGFPPGRDGITPEFLLDTTQELLSPYDRWITPMALGTSANPAAWPRFAHRSWELGMPQIDVWRYGVTPTATVQYLGANPPGDEPST